VKKIRDLIENLDRCRVGRCESVAKMDKLVEELGLSLPHEWESLKRDIAGIMQLPRRSRTYPRLARLEAFSTILARMNFGLIGAAFAAYFTGMYQLTIGLLISSIIMINIVYLVRTYVKMRVGRIYIENLDELEKLGYRIRDVVEYLIRILKRELRGLGYDPGSFRLKLYVPDYRGIEIKSKPSVFSSHYTVVLAASR